MRQLLNVFNSPERAKFMSLVGGAFVFTFLLLMIYQFVQINIFFAQNPKFDLEVYERLTAQYNNDLFDIVMIIVLYFFNKKGEDSPLQETQSTALTNNTEAD